jgi:predicted nucleic acid-binding protein
VTSIIVDAGPLIALFDRNDRHHGRAVKFIRNLRSRLLSNIPVLTEATFLLRFSVEAQRDLLWWSHKTLEIDQDTTADLPRIIALFEKYSDLPVDFADASLVALAERLGLSRIASLDRDFGVYRMLGSRRFDNVFLGAD